MSNEREQKLATLFDDMVKGLAAKVASGEANSQDYKNIIQLMKDNGINCEVKKGSPLDRLRESLPFTAEEVAKPN
jgi:hypothetical protein